MYLLCWRSEQPATCVARAELEHVSGAHPIRLSGAVPFAPSDAPSRPGVPPTAPIQPVDAGNRIVTGRCARNSLPAARTNCPKD